MLKKITLLIFLLFIAAIVTKFVTNWYLQSYASFTNGQNETVIDGDSNLSSLEIVNKINELRDNYNNYIVKNFDKISKNYPKNTKKQDKLYSEYLRQLQKYSDSLYLDLNLSVLSYEGLINSRGFASIYKDKVGYSINVKKDFVSGEIFNPFCPVLKIVHCGEGDLCTVINYDYLLKNKSMLGPAMQEYLNLRKKEETILNNSKLFLGAGEVSVPMSTLTDWIIMWQDFLKKNPRFYLKDVINYDIRKYTYYFAAYDFYPNSETVSYEAKKEYKTFLKKVNPKTDSYAFVKRCYDMLEMNNFKYSDNGIFAKEIIRYRDKYKLPARY